jgi:GxxExxY protein
MAYVPDPLVERVIGCAIVVHRELGPGLLESIYQRCLCIELQAGRIPFRTEVSVPVFYRRERLDMGYRIDLLIDGWLVIEVKSVERLLPVHTAQLLTYVKLAGARQGLLLNFNAPTLREGLKSVLIRTPSSPPPSSTAE